MSKEVNRVEEMELIERSRQGNKSAMNALLSHNYPILMGYLIKLTGDKYLSEDIMQETMMKAIINIEKYKPLGKFSTYLITIATNAFRDYLRKNKRIKFVSELPETLSENVEDSVLGNIEYKEILSILQNLSYEKRAVFVLKHYYGYKYEEIAKILNCPVGTVRSRLHNSIVYIMNEMERRGMCGEG